MAVAQWRPTPTEREGVIVTLGDGLNQATPSFAIGDGEATYMRELDSRKYPALAVRPGRSTSFLASSTNVQGLGQRNNADLHEINDNTWRYWAAGGNAWTNISTTLSTAGVAKFEEFVTGTARYLVLFNSTQYLYWDGTSLTTAAPPVVTNLFAVHAGRVYTLLGGTITYSALNKLNDYATANDAGTILITNAKGAGTGITTYADHVIAFTEYSMHELWGTAPSSYQLVDVAGNVGCISDRSIVQCNGNLYWLWYDGVYEYTGGFPKRISHPAVTTDILNLNTAAKTKAAAGASGKYVYLAIATGSSTTNNLVLKYDTELGKWYEEAGAFAAFVTIAGTLYAVDYAGQHWNVRDLSLIGSDGNGVGPIAWEWQSKPYQDAALEGRKTLDELWMVADISTGSTGMSVQYSTAASGTAASYFTTISTQPGSSDTQQIKVIVPRNELQDVPWYRLRLAGSGDATVYELQKNLRVRQR